MTGQISSVLVLLGGVASFVCAFMADRRPQVLAMLVAAGGALLSLTADGAVSATVIALLGWRILVAQLRKDTKRYQRLD